MALRAWQALFTADRMSKLARLFAVLLLLASASVHAALPMSSIYRGSHDNFQGTASELVAHWQALQPVRNCWDGSSHAATWYYVEASEDTIQLGYRSAGCTGSGPYDALQGISGTRISASCPANSSASGSSCACNAGFVEEGGSCVVPSTGTDHQKECYAFSGLQRLPGGVLVSEIALQGSVADGAQLCYPIGSTPGSSQGCTVTFSNSSTASWPDGSKTSYGEYNMTPATKNYGNNLPDYTCSTDAGNTPKENKTSSGEKCIGYVGTVNGVESCIKGTSSATGVDITGGTSTTINSDGSKSETKNDTSCTGGKCTTTTTTTNTSSSGATSTSTTSSTQTQAAYCSGSGAGTAACTGSGSGSGSSACEKNSSAAGCGGTAAEIGELYKKKDRTVADVLNDAKSTMEGAPITSAMAGFLSVQAGGSCPMWVWQVPYFNVTIAVDAFCSTWAMQAYGWVATAVLLVASFLAFRIAVE